MFQENIDVFPGSDAAKQNDVAIARQNCRELPHCFLERFAVARISFININRGEFAQIGKGDCRSCIDQSPRWRDDEHAAISIGRARERVRVSDLAAKIEAAQKSEHLGDRGAAFAPQFRRQLELRSLAQNHLGAPAAGISRRKYENASVDVASHN